MYDENSRHLRVGETANERLTPQCLPGTQYASILHWVAARTPGCRWPKSSVPPASMRHLPFHQDPASNVSDALTVCQDSNVGPGTVQQPKGLHKLNDTPRADAIQGAFGPPRSPRCGWHCRWKAGQATCQVRETSCPGTRSPDGPAKASHSPVQQSTLWHCRKPLLARVAKAVNTPHSNPTALPFAGGSNGAPTSTEAGSTQGRAWTSSP